MEPQINMSLKLGIYQNKHKLCCLEFCIHLPLHTNGENILKNQLSDNILRPQISHTVMKSERDFQHICWTTSERCCEQTARSRAYRKRLNLKHHYDIGQKSLYENTLKTHREAKNYNNADWDPLPSLNASLAQLIEFKMITTLLW